MQKFIVGIILVFLLATPIALWAAEPDFRYVNWGMTQGEVEWAESSLRVLRRDDQLIMYKTSYERMDCLLSYVFHEKSLVGGVYYFIHSRSNPSYYIDDYEALKSILTQKYGQPLDSQTVWKDEWAKNNPGKAIMNGDLELTTFWRRGATAIVLGLGGKNNELRFLLGCFSKDNISKLSEIKFK